VHVKTDYNQKQEVEEEVKDKEQIYSNNFISSDSEEDYSTEDEEENSFSVNSLKILCSSKKDEELNHRIFKTVELICEVNGQQKITALINTGSQIKLINKRFCESFLGTKYLAKTFSEGESVPITKLNGEFQIAPNGISCKLDLYTSRNLRNEMILEIDWCKKTGATIDFGSGTISFRKQKNETLPKDNLTTELTNFLKQVIDLSKLRESLIYKMFNSKILLNGHHPQDCSIFLNSEEKIKNRRNRLFTIARRGFLQRIHQRE
jgi:hypothetical protein